MKKQPPGIISVRSERHIKTLHYNRNLEYRWFHVSLAEGVVRWRDGLTDKFRKLRYENALLPRLKGVSGLQARPRPGLSCVKQQGDAQNKEYFILLCKEDGSMPKAGEKKTGLKITRAGYLRLRKAVALHYIKADNRAMTRSVKEIMG